jgi:predicted DNA-binding protein YlxM (UPF0122 family)
VAYSFIGGGNRNTRRKLLHKFENRLTMVEKRTKSQTMVNKTLHRKVNNKGNAKRGIPPGLKI